jgi:hypothetical protein
MGRFAFSDRSGCSFEQLGWRLVQAGRGFVPSRLNLLKALKKELFWDRLIRVIAKKMWTQPRP